MRLPPIALTRALQFALSNHNAGVNISRRDYEAHPITACHWDECEDLAPDGNWCRNHIGLAAEAARDRMRKLRKK
jgi:hypothetical protein